MSHNTGNNSECGITKRPFRGKLLILILLLTSTILFLILATRNFFDESIGYPDADRILMDGALIADFLSSLPMSNMLEFPFYYYAQYPALSLGYRPPFFPFIESLNLIAFGYNVWVGRIAVIIMALIGGVSFYIMISRMYDRLAGVIALSLLGTTPFVVQWSWYTMGEIPVLAMLLLTALSFWHYTETSKAGYAYLSAFLLALTLWNKQTAIFAIMWFILFLVFQNEWRSFIKSKTLWLSVSLFSVMILPLVVITLWLGDLNIGQSVGSNPRGAQLPRWHWENLVSYPKLLVSEQLTWPLLTMSVIGLVTAIVKSDRHIKFFLLLIISTYIFFTALNDPHIARYTIFWIPGFIALAAVPIYYLRGLAFTSIYLAFVVFAVCYNINAAFEMNQQRAGGFKEAAQYVIEKNQSRGILIDAKRNGYFTFFVRSCDPDRRFSVVRGDKVFSSSAVDKSTWVSVHAKTNEDIYRILDRHAIGHIVVEEENYTGLEIHDRFRELLAGENFALRAEFPIDSNLPYYAGQSLLVYEYLTRSETRREDFILELPIVGKRLEVPGDGSPPRLTPLSKTSEW